MYGQGNYGPHFGQGPNTPMSTAYPQRPLAPPPPPPHSHQGHSVPPPPLNQQTPPAVPPHVGHPGPHIYHQHVPPVPSLSVHQGPPIQVPAVGMPNTGQSYLQIHGSAQLPLTYSNSQQNSQYHSHIGTQNMHHLPPPVPPPLGPHSEVLQAPPPPRVLPPPPPPPPQQTLYRSPVHPRPQQPGSVQGLQHIPPRPPTYSLSGPAQVGGFVPSTVGESHMPSMVLPPPPSPPPPPPPPSSPPPGLPSPPPPTSSFTSSSAPNQVRHNAPTHVAYLNQEGGSDSEVGPLAGDGTSDGSAISDLPPPPPKPSEKKVVQNIEDLCHLISKNGNNVEDMAHINESKNPEFAFLYGGEPGSEAAIAHEYFLWMRKKCILAYKTCELQSGSSLRPLKNESSTQPDHLIVGSGRYSPTDSDMEMEDDFTQSDNDQGFNHSIEIPNNGCDLVPKKLDANEHCLHALHSLAEGSLMKEASSEKGTCSGPSKIGEEGLHLDNSTFRKPIYDVHIPIVSSAGASEHTIARNLEKSSAPLSNEIIRPSKTFAPAETIPTDKCFGEPIQNGSPFRLLQGYASDDSSENDDKPHREDGCPLTLSPSITPLAINSNRDSGYNLGTDVVSKGFYRRTEKGFGLHSESSIVHKVPEVTSDSQKVVKDTGTVSISSGTTDEHVDYNHENQVAISHAASREALLEKDDLGGTGIDVSKSAMSQKKNKEKNMKLESTPLKVDEFGRLVKDDATDSDTDDSRHTRRRSKRGRSRSRSQSPIDRGRRSRPRKRRERRSRSRSWSPRNRRSRSRSPLSWRAGEVSVENARRQKGHLPECFDFRRGRCYRGASCRYMHHESDRSSGSRYQKSKRQYPEDPPSLRNSNTREDIHKTSANVSNNEREASKSQELHPYQDVHGATKDGNISWKREDILNDAGKSGISDSDGPIFNSNIINHESSRDVAADLWEMQVVQEKQEQQTTNIHDAENSRLTVDSQQPLSVDGFLSQAASDADIPKLQGVQNADRPSQLIHDSSISDSSPGHTSLASNKFSTSEPLPNVKSSTQPWPDSSSTSRPLSSERSSLQSLAPKESSHSISGMGFSHHPSELHPPPVSQGVNAGHTVQLLKDDLTPQGASFPFESVPGDSFLHYQVPLPKQHSQYSVPPNSSWTSLPPPPPRPLYDSTGDAGTATPGVSSQFQQSSSLPYSSQASVRIYPSDRAAYIRVSEFPLQACPPGQGPNQPLPYVEDLGSNPLPKSNHPSQPFSGINLMRENHFPQLPAQDLISSSSFAAGNMLPSARELFKDKMHSFSGDSLPPGELIKSSSQSLPYSQSQQPPYGLKYPATDIILGEPGKTGSVSRYPSDLLGGHQSSQLPDFGGSRISAHHNPYASTFEQPLSSKFSSGVFKQEKDAPYSSKFDSSFKPSHVPVDGLGVGHVRSSQMTFSPSSTKAIGQLLPRSGGDQYDPLFDSIEPALNSFRRDDHGQKPELTGESDSLLRFSGTCKLPDVEEKHKEIGAVASTTSLDNDEYGETADAEVGAVENESPSTPVNVANVTGGDIEIDQIKSSGKSKKSKDSRSMKLFKIAVADFVKEVLKPSWRQGNMSKEAFKTIVKKTVDKVSGAMKSHKVPKSQAKIDQYIDSSQRKLTKLVMGYVDKYVKV
ncbi:uncharacterized protein LOC121235985 isoform X2 [Juglans microcarpa x Juglans regia]|uniref:uncharacterized protein LOC121235985 isoform X2 n=1 Tax=Juglans microcarpa x Juglans regia TaxID=2249226 RepID=UPI001B7F60F7|nr:uncharacterized protein LOC121235985 isoform X2 [Juglans microcarpa x Juglans regia]